MFRITLKVDGEAKMLYFISATARRFICARMARNAVHALVGKHFRQAHFQIKIVGHDQDFLRTEPVQTFG